MNSHYKTERTEPEVKYVGLDVSKARLDYTLEGERTAHVPNTDGGITRLIAQFQGVPGVRIVCEATGGYERRLLAALHAAQLGACRVQPGRVRAFARAEGLQAKTDRIDARLLRRYAQSMHPRLDAPVSAAVATLRDLVDYRRQVSDQLTVTRNRRENAGPTLLALLEEQQVQLQATMAKVSAAIATHLAAQVELAQKAARLQQLQGVGPILAITLLAYLPELGHEDDKRIAALVGVAPFNRESGTTVQPSHTHGGRVEVRNVLYMAAVAATQHNPVLAAFYARLRATGKPPKVCLVAVMRKMLLVLNRMLRDPNFILAQ
jgi:transposase